jgi:hypothetical protein
MMSAVSPSSAASFTAGGSPSSRRMQPPRSRSRSPGSHNGSPSGFGAGRSAGSPKSFALESTLRSVTSFDMGDEPPHHGDDHHRASETVVQLSMPPTGTDGPPDEHEAAAAGGGAAQRASAVSPEEDVDWGDFKMSVNPQQPLDADDVAAKNRGAQPLTSAEYANLQPTAFGSVVPDHLSAEAAAEVMAMHQRRVRESREGRRAARSLLPSQLLALRRAGGAVPCAETPPVNGSTTDGSVAPSMAAVKGGAGGPRALLQSRGAQNRRRHMQELLQRSQHEAGNIGNDADASSTQHRRPATTTTATPEPRRSATPLDRAAHAKTPMPTGSAVAKGGGDPLQARGPRRALATPATSIPRSGTAAQPMLPAPIAGQYSTFVGCEPVPEPSSPGPEGPETLLGPSADPDPEAQLPQLLRTASAASSLGMGPDPAPQRRFAGEDRHAASLAAGGGGSRSSSQRSIKTRAGGARGVPPAVRRVLQRSEAMQAARGQQQSEGATPFAFTTLGVRSIPLATAAGPDGGGPGSRPGTTPMEAEADDGDSRRPLPAITAGPGSSGKRAATPLWVNSHRV